MPPYLSNPYLFFPPPFISIDLSSLVSDPKMCVGGDIVILIFYLIFRKKNGNKNPTPNDQYKDSVEVLKMQTVLKMQMKIDCIFFAFTFFILHLHSQHWYGTVRYET